MNAFEQLQQIPPNTKLKLVYNLQGSCNSLRTFIRLQNRNMILRIEDINNKYFGKEATCYITPSMKVQRVYNGFALILDDEVVAEYQFVE